MEPKIGTFINCETGEEVTRELTEEEISALTLDSPSDGE